MTSRGFFSIGVVHPKHGINVGTLWRTANLYGAASVFTVGRRYQAQASDTMATPRHVPLHNYLTIDELIEHLPHGTPLIGIEMDPRAHPLSGFHHPERACYLLGAEDHGLTQVQIERCHQLIQIECPAVWSMNVAVAGSLVVHHRYTSRLKAQVNA